jgi:hypothetical protein
MSTRLNRKNWTRLNKVAKTCSGLTRVLSIPRHKIYECKSYITSITLISNLHVELRPPVPIPSFLMFILMLIVFAEI